ncbi:MAG: 2-succinyl-6-hydroxy-2,4-cyclohexadiene-1-carboxylate synthase [Verrucomicrobia bacterium]|nr:2-succinyl-6-hydroxy-2,4-cyclohexadiene-1-carboxylate synthase [Verrucomicrobiota bacterium]MDA1087041.1 2-succinyl-6-hydroxy-2,4-cyclohexadiene-1-carboxylate synthase [Verrucomicrobiota bacterium]
MLHAIKLGEKSGTGLIFLHGFMGSGEEWRGIAESVSRRWQAVLVDLPGHGASIGLAEAATTWEGACGLVHEILDSSECERHVLIGYSMGARIAIQIAIDAPARLAGLVIESGTAGLEDPTERDIRRQIDRERAAELERVPIEIFVRHWYQQDLFKTLARRRDLLEEIVGMRARNDPSELARAVSGLSVATQPNLWTRLGELSVPTLIVTGALDENYESIADRISAATLHSRRVSIAACGHSVHCEAPSAFAEELVSFVESLSCVL